MNRCLHITIHESACALPQRATAYLPGPAGTDPGASYVMPPVDDPGASYIMPPVDDPESSYVMPPVDDPRRTLYLTGRAGVPGAAVATVFTGDPGIPFGPGGAAPGRSGAAPPGAFVTPQDYSGFVIVRMAEGAMSQAGLAGSLWALAAEHRPRLTGLLEVLELGIDKDKDKDKDKEGQKAEQLPSSPPSGAFASRPLVELLERCNEPLPRDKTLTVLRALEKKASTTAFPPLHSLTAYWRLDLRQRPDLAEEVVERLNRLPEVDLAYRELAATDPRVTATAGGQVFAEDQGYLDDAPLGISASWAWKCLTTAPSPAAVTLCDLEQGWHPDHQDLKPLVRPDLVFGSNRAPHEGSTGHHGTAVLGQLAAAGKSAFGIRGAAADIGRFVLASHYVTKTVDHPLAGTSGNVAAAIAQALCPPASSSLAQLIPLTAGDILLLEVQRGLLPAEVDEVDFDAIRLAAALGIVVIEPAGNGGFDLDGYTDPATGRSLRRGAPGFHDSGAILVGACRAALPHDRAPFSNHGSRLDCFGWGEAVTTCGYGDLAGTGATDSYTNTFSGTSSAAPIIAGAAALLQSLHQTHSGERLELRALRALLADPATGTRQGPNVPGHIGVMPDLRAIVRERLQLVPDIYLRHSIGDGDAPPVPGGEVSSSPDILVWPEGPIKARARFGDGGGRENTAAPGNLIRPGESNNVYVRLRNRGLGAGEGQVQLFASPVATLITPERWIPIQIPGPSPLGGLAVSQIPQGDALFVVGPFIWQAPPSPVNTWSFLAVFNRPGEGSGPLGPPWFDGATGLPPGPPYFDWAEYRAFLRRPEVAWRNTHRVTAAAPLTFSITGTPDRARSFDFEVIQRLPAGVKVTLQVPDALAAKLRQRQPWLGGGTVPLSLPKRPRTLLREVQLAAGARVPASFTVQVPAGGPPLLAGHSLALRQLWRGEEVGRITWYFGPEL